MRPVDKKRDWLSTFLGNSFSSIDMLLDIHKWRKAHMFSPQVSGLAAAFQLAFPESGCKKDARKVWQSLRNWCTNPVRLPGSLLFENQPYKPCLPIMTLALVPHQHPNNWHPHPASSTRFVVYWGIPHVTKIATHYICTGIIVEECTAESYTNHKTRRKWTPNASFKVEREQSDGELQPKSRSPRQATRCS